MGLLYKSTLRAGINIAEKDSSGFIIAQLKRDFFNIDKDLFICFVYIPPSTLHYYETPDFDYIDLLESKLVKYSEYGDFCIIGDLNARCGERCDYLNDQSVLDCFFESDDCYILPSNTIQRPSMDKSTNSSGLKLLQLCKNSNLRIVNGRVGDDAADGQFTFLSTSGCSLIDYVLFPCNLFPIISNFIVHDLQSFSSHSPIQITFETYPVIDNSYGQNK